MRKLTFIVLGLVSAIGLAGFEGEAHARLKRTGGSEAPVVTSQSAAESAPSSGGHMRFGLGFTTNNLDGNSTGVSGWLNFNQNNALQVMFGIDQTGATPSVGGGVQLGGGLAYRYTIHGGMNNGFHLGGSVNLGSASTGPGGAFYISMAPLLGFHFAVPSLQNIGVSLDGGPRFLIFDGNFNFAARALSPDLGLSIHYFF